MTLGRLRLLNLLRWIKEYAISWGLLSAIYSYTLALILQPVLQKTLGGSVALPVVWILGIVLLLIPAGVEFLPAPPFHHPRWIIGERWFSEAGFRNFGGPLLPLYLRHELRRFPTLLGIGFTTFAGVLLPLSHRGLWILIAQFPVQRALFSLQGWRGIALSASPTQGGSWILRTLLVSQLIQLMVAWLALGLSGAFPMAAWLQLGAGALSAVICSSSVALEGDSGRPWMVNFFSLAAGAVGGFLGYAYPWTVGLSLYIFYSMQAGVGKRLLSVEHLDEDRLLP